MPRTTNTNADQQHASLERRFDTGWPRAISIAGRQLEVLRLTGAAANRPAIVFLRFAKHRRRQRRNQIWPFTAMATAQ